MVIQLNQEKIVNIAIKSMLYEVTVNPKPGLVDPVRSGAHPDMDVFDFIDSALCLRPYFARCFSIGTTYNEQDLRGLFRDIRGYGIDAEKKMLTTTKGINTHKGAIFSLGILVTAVGYQSQQTNFLIDQLPVIISGMVEGLIGHDFVDVYSKKSSEMTAGEKQFVMYGIRGIRGQAVSGYPAVFKYGFPYLCQTTGTRNQRLLDTFMKIVSCTQDSNLIKRAGSVDIVDWVQSQAVEFLKLGGSKTKEGMKKLVELDCLFTKKKLSLGGCADMLILTIFLGLLTEYL